MSKKQLAELKALDEILTVSEGRKPSAAQLGALVHNRIVQYAKKKSAKKKRSR